MEKSSKKILQERLDEDEHGWKPFNTLSAVDTTPILSWIRGYFNTDEGKEIEKLEIREEKLTPPFAKQVLELRNAERNRGYVFFVGIGSRKLSASISENLVIRRYNKILRNTEKYFVDLKEDLSGFYWETNLDLKGNKSSDKHLK